MFVDLIPTRTDNYVFVLSGHDDSSAVVVDPSDFEPVDSFLRRKTLVLKTVLVTHHHPDHVGGIAQLKAKYNCRVVAAEKDRHRIPWGDDFVKDGDVVSLGDHKLCVLETPGHTLGHIAYHYKDLEWLFSGDTLFSIGCGRLFEGTPLMMVNSLTKLSRLPSQTKVYCTHEYTLANLEFARDLDPDNEELKEFQSLCRKRRELGHFTVPTTIGVEKKLNPFLRCGEFEYRKALGLPESDPIEAFAEIRRRKDHF